MMYFIYLGLFEKQIKNQKDLNKNIITLFPLKQSPEYKIDKESGKWGIFFYRKLMCFTAC